MTARSRDVNGKLRRPDPSRSPTASTRCAVPECFDPGPPPPPVAPTSHRENGRRSAPSHRQRLTLPKRRTPPPFCTPSPPRVTPSLDSAPTLQSAQTNPTNQNYAKIVPTEPYPTLDSSVRAYWNEGE